MLSKRETLEDRIFITILFVILFIAVAIVLYPLIYMLSCSVSTPQYIGSGAVWLFPKGLNIIGYQRVFQDPAIMTGYANTLFYATAGTAINIVVTVPAGYSLSKATLPGRKFFTLFFLFIMYFSGGMIPSFLLIKNLGLYNTRIVLIVLGAFSAYNCIICRTFFASIPQELEDAAAIDGCSPMRSFIQIALPISQALLGVMTLYFIVGHWNSYFSAMMYTIDQKYAPLQLILRRILILEQASTEMLAESTDSEYMMELSKVRELIKYAVIVVSSLPLLIIYPFLQKYFVKGVLIGSVKG